MVGLRCGGDDPTCDGTPTLDRRNIIEIRKQMIIKCSNCNKKVETQSKPLTLGELKVGTSFIPFPLDGDDSGHGGYRGGHILFTKVSGSIAESYMSLNHSFQTNMKVIKILV